MHSIGTTEQPLRVAVVGSGPAGFYVTQHLFQDRERPVRVDMFDRLPTPFGLVRHGVAPDHPKIKAVTAVYQKLASDPRFRFFGNVEYGTALTLADLQTLYHQVVFCTGAQTDRRMGIPGEDLEGSHPATEFVAWYNGHPDFTHLSFDLSCRAAVVVGVGNVAVDVARVLCRRTEELAKTDIADDALRELEQSRIREVTLLGRRGPAQAAFSNPEVKELGEIEGTETSVPAAEARLDEVSRRAVEAAGDKATARKLEILESYADRRLPGAGRKLILRFLVSPVEILGDDAGRVRGVRVVHNELYETEDGALRSRPTSRFETLEAGLVFRSVGYHGVPLPDVPFDKRAGIVPNAAGRVLGASDSQPLTGLYVSGWIKRGPSGVIGTNKPDGKETAARMLEDAASGTCFEIADAGPDRVTTLLDERGVEWISYDDWKKIDALEVSRGQPLGRPRVKLTRRDEFSQALDR